MGGIGGVRLTHLLHHGIVCSAMGVSIRPVSAILWFALMTGTGFVFAHLRRRSGSLRPAIVAHAAFNLGKNATIFAFLW